MRSGHPNRLHGFTLVELLLVIAIIGVMSALIVASVSGAAEDSRRVIARQQQVVLQEALGAWVSAQVSGTNSLANARTAYNNASGSAAKLSLIRRYLDDSTYASFTITDGKIQSEAMTKLGAYLQFSGTWTTGSYPKINMVEP